MDKKHSTLWVSYLRQMQGALVQGKDFPAEMTLRRAQERMHEVARRKGLTIATACDQNSGILSFRVTGLRAVRLSKLARSCRATGTSVRNAVERAIGGSNTASL